MTARVTLREAADFLLAHDDYLLLSHRRPDGDTAGSCAALCRALRALGKRAWVYPNPQFTPRFAPYLEGLVGRPDPRPPHSDAKDGGNGGQGSGSREQESSKAFPLRGRGPEGPDEVASRLATVGFTLLSCDIASRGLFPFGMEDAEVELAIDHHGTNDGFAARTLVDGGAAACGELLASLIPALGVRLDKPMAEALYVAIATDTGCFRYSNVTAATLRAAAACVDAGAEIFPINRVFFEIKRRPRLALEAWLVEHMEYYAGGRVAVSAIPQTLMDELKLTEDDIDDISGFGRTIEGVQIAVMLREVEQGMGKASVRTSPEYDAARICRRLGGGGHPAAAGASLPGGLPAIREAVLASIAEEIPL